MNDLFGYKTATFSPCRKYRYSLFRWWDKSKPYVMFIGLNPSTADETKDDPTIRRCIGFARKWGYGGVCMANIFAFRATDPLEMKSFEDPVGPDNNEWLKKLASGAGEVVAAWGVHGVHLGRNVDVRGLIPFMMCIGTTKDGHPKHPLYIPYKNSDGNLAVPVPF